MQTRKGELSNFNIISSNVIKKKLISTFFILIGVQSNNLNSKKKIQQPNKKSINETLYPISSQPTLKMRAAFDYLYIYQ